jgi:UDP-N-acetyl-2-amino-2-deoxyglucuronate dehydrogenase
MKNFALTGAAGYIAPRHLKAIRDTGNRLVAACDPHDAVGILDSFFPDAAYFREFERFDRHLELLRRRSPDDRVHVVSVCSPNHLHDAHVRTALRVGADVLCEKPLVLNPWNLDALQELESETGHRVSTVLQLRVHPALVELKRKVDARAHRRATVVLSYVTARGTWYRYSWKGDDHKSGGVATNIGIHFFDLLMWLFGASRREEVALNEPTRISGLLELERADVLWFLSIDRNDLPFEATPGHKTTFRSITIDGEEVEFTEGFTDLHTRVYEETLAGRGFGIAESRPSIELTHRVRNAAPTARPAARHPFLERVPNVGR